jgi:hypothetical protein
MAITDRLKRLFTTGSVPDNTSREITPVVRPSATTDLRGRLFGDESGRHEIIRRCRDMYAADPRAEGMLRMMARDATRHGFTLTVAGSDAQSRRAQEIAAAAVRRLKLKTRIEDWVRLGARDGDLYLEPGVGRDMTIVEVTRKPTLGMVRLSDAFDRFPDPARAFAYVDPSAAALGLVDERATYFPQFLMVHARWNHDSESRYGTPEFASARGAWKKLTEGELDLAIRRKTRAGIKYVHSLIGATDADIDAYKTVNEQALNNPFAAAADFFLNFEGGIDVLDGDPHLGEMADIYHHLQTWSAASVVPLELLAYGENLNRDVLGEKRAQYDETLEQVRAWAADEIIAPLIEREWLLAGILPESLEYAVGWPSRKVVSPADLNGLVAAVNAMRTGGWSEDAVWALIEPYVPDEIGRDALFAGPPPAPAAPGLAAAETAGAVNRLLGRLEQAQIDAETGEFWPLRGREPLS